MAESDVMWEWAEERDPLSDEHNAVSDSWSGVCAIRSDYNCPTKFSRRFPPNSQLLKLVADFW